MTENKTVVTNTNEDENNVNYLVSYDPLGYTVLKERHRSGKNNTIRNHYRFRVDDVGVTVEFAERGQRLQTILENFLARRKGD